MPGLYPGQRGGGGPKLKLRVWPHPSPQATSKVIAADVARAIAESWPQLQSADKLAAFVDHAGCGHILPTPPHPLHPSPPHPTSHHTTLPNPTLPHSPKTYHIFVSYVSVGTASLILLRPTLYLPHPNPTPPQPHPTPTPPPPHHYPIRLLCVCRHCPARPP